MGVVTHRNPHIQGFPIYILLHDIDSVDSVDTIDSIDTHLIAPATTLSSHYFDRFQ